VVVTLGENLGPLLIVGDDGEGPLPFLGFEVAENLGRFDGVDFREGVAQVDIRLSPEKATDHILDLKKPGVALLNHDALRKKAAA
jgi:hypothetical protein